MAAVTVETHHSTYHFDTDAQVFTRLRNTPDASRLDGDGEPQTYEWYALPITPGDGRNMSIGLLNGKIRETTPVLKVTTVD